MPLLTRIRSLALVAVLLGGAVPLPAQRMPPRPAPPRFPPMSPEQVRMELRNTLALNPQEIFARLKSQGQFLPAEERAKFAEEALARLATRVEVSNNRWDTLKEVLQARSDAESLDAALRADLAVLIDWAERRALADILFEVGHLIEREKWDDAVRRGEEWQKRLRRLYQERTDGRRPRSQRETLEPLAGVIRIGQESAALDALQDALRRGYLDRVTVANLPVGLHDEVQGVRGWKTVRDLSEEIRLSRAEIARLNQNLDAFTKVQRKLPDADAALGGKILQEVAVRHLLHGHATEYRALMPADGPAEHAALLLRDVKALILGKGEVVTEPARAVLEEIGKTGEPPVGVRALIPQENRKNWHPPALGAKTEPPARAKADAVVKNLKMKIETNLKSERITWRDREKEGRRRLDEARRRLQKRDEEDGKRQSEIASLLDRPLQAREKLAVRRLASEKQTNRQIVARLKQAKAAEKPNNPR